MRSSISIILLTISMMASAQSGIVSTREANPPDGKLMSIGQASLGRLLPENPRLQFDGNDLIFLEKGHWKDWASKQEYHPVRESFTVTETEGSVVFKDRNGSKVIAAPEKPGIVYGGTVSRNEFGIEEFIFVSPDSSRVAFYRKDESAVTEFPLLDITTRTGSLVNIRYPMAGMTSEKITLQVYDIASGSTVTLDVTDFSEERYLAAVTWTPDSRSILVQVLDRSQKHLKLNMYDAVSGAFVRTLLTEDNERYVEPRDPQVWFLRGSSDRFIYRTDNRSGYRNLYLCSLDGSVERLTCVDADVEYAGNDGRYVYYTSAEVSPVENHLFRADLGKNALKAKTTPAKLCKGAHFQRLTFERGWHDISLSEDCNSFVDHWSSFDFPGATDLCSTDGKTRTRLHTAADPSNGYAFTRAEFGTVKSADGKYDNYYRLFKPLNFDPSKKYPVILYVYGGPHSQMVRDEWLGKIRLWEMYMAQRGYIVYVQDNRGTDNRGAAFEKAIHRRCGQCEMEDQMVGIRMLMDLPFVDRDRIGVHGWSYGGFMTISLMTTYPEVFKAGVAGGPVIDWKWYEVMYGERYMETPQTNPDGYALTSLIAKAPQLKGKLLICQGAIDDTVVWEHSLSFVRECIRNNVQVDYFPYPCAEHNVKGKDRVHLMTKVSNYFEDYL